MNPAEEAQVAESTIDLLAIFVPETIVTIPPNAKKPEVMSNLVDSLAQAERISRASVGSITAALLERERFATTGLGRGLALPHLRSLDIDEFAGAIGVAPSGVDFDSLDGLPTRLIVLLLSPFEQRARHAEIMGRLATLLSNKTLQYSVQIPRSATALFRFLGFPPMR